MSVVTFILLRNSGMIIHDTIELSSSSVKAAKNRKV